jgi:hypothetical protein
LTLEVLLVAYLVLAALTGCLAVAAARPARLWSVGVLVLAVLWPLVNHPLEGPILWKVAPGHGLTLSDLLAPAGFITGAWLLSRASRTSPVVSPEPSVHLKEQRKEG